MSRSALESQKVDAIICPSNEDLICKPKLQESLHAAGGSKLKDEWARLKQKVGKLNIGHSVISDGGSLGSKHLIYAVAPATDEQF